MITDRLGLEDAGRGVAAVCNPVEHDSLKVILLPHGPRED
jgi:hypothetical protein